MSLKLTLANLAIAAILLTACSSSKKFIDEDCLTCKGSVILFIGLDCPISQKYIPRLNDLVRKYGSSISWIGLIPKNVSKQEIENFGKEYGVIFPLQVDESLKLARRYQANVTPEVFLFDGEGNLKYSGAIDNWFADLGKYRQHTTEHYLDSALAAVVNKKEPSLKSTKALGCFIEGRR